MPQSLAHTVRVSPENPEAAPPAELPEPSAPEPPAPGPAPAATPAPRSLIHHADFRRLWLGDGLGQLGAQLGNLAIPVFAVATLDATAWQMGALTAAESAAFLAIGLPAGAWVDRMRKRSTLISADLVRATVLAVVVVVALTGHASMPVLYAAALAMSAATVFFDVAYQSYLPGLVGPTHLVQGNSLLQATQSVAQIAGPALGGALLRVLSAPMLLVGTVVTYLSSAASVSRIRMVEQLPDPATRRPLRHEIAEGLAFVLRHPLLRRVVASTGISNLASSIAGALLVLYVLRELGLTEAQLGVVLSASAIGGLLGAVASSRLARWFGEGRVIPLLGPADSAPAWALIPLAEPHGAPRRTGHRDAHRGRRVVLHVRRGLQRRPGELPPAGLPARAAGPDERVGAVPGLGPHADRRTARRRARRAARRHPDAVGRGGRPGGGRAARGGLAAVADAHPARRSPRPSRLRRRSPRPAARGR